MGRAISNRAKYYCRHFLRDGKVVYSAESVPAIIDSIRKDGSRRAGVPPLVVGGTSPRKIRGIWALGWKNTPNNFVPRGTAKRVRAEGPTHRPAKGNALEDGRQEDGFLGPTGQPVFSGEWLGRWPERPPSHGHLDPGRCPSLGDLTPVPGSHARARNKSGINCHPCPLVLLRGPWWACARKLAGPTLRLQFQRNLLANP